VTPSTKTKLSSDSILIPDDAFTKLPLSSYEVDLLLIYVQDQATRLNIPISEHTNPHVLWNTRSTKRLGCCYTGKDKNYKYTIEISASLPRAGIKQCLNTLAHEILHTCPDCHNHGSLWKSYAARMSRTYGYDIHRVTDATANGIALPKRNVTYHWQITCQSCGNRFFRQRDCSVTSHPDQYRCAKCHTGRLKVEHI